MRGLPAGVELGHANAEDTVGEGGHGRSRPRAIPSRGRIWRGDRLGSHDARKWTRRCVSTRTVKSHRNHGMHKMNRTRFSDLIEFAVRNNRVDL